MIVTSCCKLVYFSYLRDVSNLYRGIIHLITKYQQDIPVGYIYTLTIQTPPDRIGMRVPIPSLLTFQTLPRGYGPFGTATFATSTGTITGLGGSLEEPTRKQVVLYVFWGMKTHGLMFISSCCLVKTPWLTYLDRESYLPPKKELLQAIPVMATQKSKSKVALCL